MGHFIDSVLVIFLSQPFLRLPIALHVLSTLHATGTTQHDPTSPPIHIPEHTSSISIISTDPNFEKTQTNIKNDDSNLKINETEFQSADSNLKIDESNLKNQSNRIYSFSTINRRCLSPISGSLEQDSYSDISERIEREINFNKPQLLYDYINDKVRYEKSRLPSTITATNELPLTELNLELFTSDTSYIDAESLASSTNELPLSYIKLKSEDELDNMLPSRSFSDPNILDREDNSNLVDDNKDRREIDSKYFPPIDSARAVNSEPLARSLYAVRSYSHPYRLSPMEVPLYPYSFYPSDSNTAHRLLLNAPPSRSASQPAQLSLNALTSPVPSVSPVSPLKRAPSPPIVHRSPVNPEASSGVKRHRHSIAGQMSYIKMLGFGFGGPIGLKKITGGSSNSLFSTAVISGSSSAPNLRDMIPSTASATGA